MKSTLECPSILAAIALLAVPGGLLAENEAPTREGPLATLPARPGAHIPTCPNSSKNFLIRSNAITRSLCRVRELIS